MRRLTLGGVPLHPALVHFPVAFWSCVLPMDAAYALGLGPQYWRWGCLLALAGLATALPAIVAGTLDGLASRSAEAAQGDLWRHAMLMALTWTLFGLGSLVASPDDPGGMWVAAASMHLAGFLALLAGAHAGGRLAHLHRLPGSAVDPRARYAAGQPSSPSLSKPRLE
ncbi:MAG TPA: DUF2231 domain-containing protein [Dongiaceae bacterium]